LTSFEKAALLRKAQLVDKVIDKLKRPLGRSFCFWRNEARLAAHEE